MVSHLAIVPENAAASDAFGQHTPSRDNNPGKISRLGASLLRNAPGDQHFDAVACLS